VCQDNQGQIVFRFHKGDEVGRFFILSATIFDVRFTKYGAKELTSIPWRGHLVVLYRCSGTILVRSIFRVIEYLMGNDGWILRHEIMLYVFDALLMLSVALLV